MILEAVAKKAISEIEAGKLEIRPVQINLLEVLSRVTPDFAFKLSTKTTRAK